MQPLNRTKAIWDRQTRNDININWDIIENNLGSAGSGSVEALAKANQAISDSAIAKTVAESTQVQLNDIIINSGTSDAEVIQARAGYDVLNTRLSTTDQQVAQEFMKTNEKINDITIFVEDFGAVGDGTTDDTAAFNAAIQSAITNKVKLSTKGKTYKLNGITIDGTLDFCSSINNTTLNFSSMTTGSAIKIARPGGINRLSIDGFRLVCNSNITGLQINDVANLASPVEDSVFKNLRIENASIGIRTGAAWDLTFENVRAQGCVKPLQMDAQSNNVLFNRCSFVSFSQNISFSNVEGAEFASCEVANFTGTGYAMGMFQSSVIFTNPYIEYINNKRLMEIGTASEVTPSTFIVLGGLGGGVISINNVLSVVKVNGIRQGVNDPLVVECAPGAVNPLAKQNLDISVNKRTFNTNKVLKSWYGNTPLPFPPAFGGQTASSQLNNDNYSVVDATQGLAISTELEIGKQYTLILAVRNNTNTSLVVRLAATASILNKVPQPGNPFTVQYIPFIATATGVRLEFAGKLDVALIELVEGIDVEQRTILDKQLFGNAAPTSGTWTSGKKIYLPQPVAAGHEGVVCTASGTPGTWKNFGSIQS